MLRSLIRPIIFLIALSTAVIVQWQLIDRVGHPWTLTLILWALISSLAAYFAQYSVVRAVWVNIAVVLFALGGTEAWFVAQEEKWRQGRYEGGFEYNHPIDHQVLGYGPTVNQKASSRKYIDNELVFDVIYTIDADGLRLTPRAKQPRPDGSILFFGGSMTFGDGVEDGESMPYRVGELAPSKQVYNFGVNGYGPHQMLATLEFGLYKSIVDAPVSHVIYTAIPGHVRRVNGLAPWDRRGPWYRMTAEGDIEYAGSFEDSRSRLLNYLLPALDESKIYQKSFGIQRALKPEDIDLYVSIVASARDRANALFPDSQFHVLLWDYEDDPTVKRIYDGFFAADIRTHLISDILPEYNHYKENYQIGIHESHPNALAYDLIAKYIVTEILNGHDE